MVGKKVLVAVDGSKDSEAAFDYACKVTKKEKIIVANCYKEPNSEIPFDMITPVDYGDEPLKHSRKILERFAEKCQQRQKDCEFKSLSYDGGSGRLGQSLCDEAQRSQVSQVILGCRGLSLGARLWAGSVSNAVMQCSPTTVTIVRPPFTDEERISVGKAVHKVKDIVHQTFGGSEQKSEEGDVYMGAPTPIRMPPSENWNLNIEKKYTLGKIGENWQRAKEYMEKETQGKPYQEDVASVYLGAPTPIRMPPSDTWNLNIHPKYTLGKIEGKWHRAKEYFEEESKRKLDKEDIAVIYMGAPTPIRMPSSKIKPPTVEEKSISVQEKKPDVKQERIKLKENMDRMPPQPVK